MDSEFQAQFDARHRVLLVTAGKRITRELYLGMYDAVQRFCAVEGPCSMILDLSAVTEFNLPFEFLREIAAMEPAVPGPMLRIAVAPQPAIFGSARVVETLRSETTGPVTVVRALDEAFAAVGGAKPADFTALASF